jgi:hypothetical protein
MDGGEIEPFKKEEEKVEEQGWMELEYYDEYQKCLTTGMFFEWFPLLTGEWSKDKYAFCHEMRTRAKSKK